jgi:hypothetical protein
LENEHLRQEICELAYTSIADEYIEPSELLDGLRDELLSHFWFSDISGHSNNLATSVAGFSNQTFELCARPFIWIIVDSNAGALTSVFENNRTANAYMVLLAIVTIICSPVDRTCHATCYRGSLSFEQASHGGR